MNNNQYNSNYDRHIDNVESGLVESVSQSSPLITEADRYKFVTKVYSIVCLQLIVTSVMCACAVSNYMHVRDYFISKDGQNLLILSIIGMISTSLCTICCCANLLKVQPGNYVILSVFTLCTSYIVSYSCLAYKPIVILQALLITITIVVCLVIYAITTKSDVTTQSSALLYAGMGFIVMTIMGMFFHSSLFEMLISFCGAALFSVYIVYDIQMIVGGKRNQFNTDDYVLASIMLYLDIVNLFLEILRILNGPNNE